MLALARSPPEWSEDISSFPHDIHTVQEFYLHLNRERPARRFAAAIDSVSGELIWYSFQQVHQMALSVGTHLLELGVAPGSRIGVYSETNLESIVFLEACHLFGYLIVFTFDSQLVPFPPFCFGDSGAVAIYVSQEKVVRLHSLLSRELPSLRFLIVNKEIDNPREFPRSDGIGFLLYDEFLRHNTFADLPVILPEHPCTICYSVGTTGPPKGAIISHGALVSGIRTISCAVNITDAHIHVSYLPLSQILERLLIFAVMYRGGSIVFGTAGAIGAYRDMNRVRATGGTMLPKMLTGLDHSMMYKISSFPRARKIMAVSLGLAKLGRFFGFRSRIADFFILKKLRQFMGGELEWLLVDGGPFPREVHERLSLIFDIDLITLYSLAECAGPIAIADRRAIEPGTVGKVVPGAEISIRNDGEILIRSDSLFTNYWNRRELTRRSFDKGWFRPGDQGSADLSGNLIVSRRLFPRQMRSPPKASHPAPSLNTGPDPTQNSAKIDSPLEE
jgi:long-chain acyl-CoA synthetase